jgi:hypothetical protein
MSGDLQLTDAIVQIDEAGVGGEDPGEDRGPNEQVRTEIEQNP